MIRICSIAAAIVSLFSFQVVAGDATMPAKITAGDLVITKAWTRATPAGAKAGGGYLTVENTGDRPDRLVSLTTPIAARAEIHEMKMIDNVMVMRPLAEGLEVPAGQTVELKPGGYHLMLMGLKEPIVEGSSIPVTLKFEAAGEVILMMMAAPIGTRQAPGHHHTEG